MQGYEIDGSAQRLTPMASNKGADELVLTILQLDESSLLVQSVCLYTTMIHTDPETKTVSGYSTAKSDSCQACLKVIVSNPIVSDADR
jgi:hypothetical protein